MWALQSILTQKRETSRDRRRWICINSQAYVFSNTKCISLKLIWFLFLGRCSCLWDCCGWRGLVGSFWMATQWPNHNCSFAARRWTLRRRLLVPGYDWQSTRESSEWEATRVSCAAKQGYRGVGTQMDSGCSVRTHWRGSCGESMSVRHRSCHCRHWLFSCKCFPTYGCHCRRVLQEVLGKFGGSPGGLKKLTHFI